MNVVIQLACRLNDTHYPVWFLGVFSVLLVVLALTEYIVLFLIPSKATYYLRQTYPDYEMAVIV
jgi:hypothetical protein